MARHGGVGKLFKRRVKKGKQIRKTGRKRGEPRKKGKKNGGMVGKNAKWRSKTFLINIFWKLLN